MMRRAAWFLGGLALFASAGSAYAVGPLEGIWGGKLGEIALIARGDQVEGTLLKSSGLCPFVAGDVLLRGVYEPSEGTIVGEARLCQGVDECGPPVWVKVLIALDLDKGRMGGVGPRASASCPLVGYSKSGNGSQALVLQRLETVPDPQALAALRRPSSPSADPAQASADKQNILRALTLPGPPADPGRYDPRASLTPPTRLLTLLAEGKQALQAGAYEQARKRFEEALAIEPANANALVGVGVSYAMRHQDAEALRYYKAALLADPNYGLALYNIACLHARNGKSEEALRFLRAALENDFVTWNTVEQDGDLASLRKLPAYRELAPSAKAGPPAQKGATP